MAEAVAGPAGDAVRSGRGRLLVGALGWVLLDAVFLMAPATRSFLPVVGLLVLFLAATGVHRLLWQGRVFAGRAAQLGSGLLSAVLTLAGGMAVNFLVGFATAALGIRLPR